MVADIGIMIAAYILTRMIGTVTDKQVNAVSRVMAILTIVITVLAFIDLVFHARSGGRITGL